jgi:hypothetical protein
MGMAAVFTAIGEHRRAPYLGHATLGLAPGLSYGAELPEAAETTGGRSPVSGLGPLGDRLILFIRLAGQRRRDGVVESARAEAAWQSCPWVLYALRVMRCVNTGCTMSPGAGMT